MADAGFFKGTSATQDTRFSDKELKLLKSMKFPPEFDKKVDMRKVNLSVIRPWIAKKVVEYAGFEDEIVIEYVGSMLEDESQPVIDPKKMQINLTGFLTKDAPKFMQDLWTLLLEAQADVTGVPRTFIEEKKEEMRKARANDTRALDERDRRARGGDTGKNTLDEIMREDRELREGRGRGRGRGRGGYGGRGRGRGGYDDGGDRRPRDSGWGGRGGGGGGGGGGRRRFSSRSPPPYRRRSRTPPSSRDGSRTPPASPSAQKRRRPSRSPPRRYRGSRSPPPRRRSPPPRRRDNRSSPPHRGDSRSPISRRRDSRSPPRRRRRFSSSRSPSPRRRPSLPRRRSPSPSSRSSRSRSPPPRRRRRPSFTPSPSPKMDVEQTEGELKIKGSAAQNNKDKKDELEKRESLLKEDLLRSKVIKSRKTQQGSDTTD